MLDDELDDEHRHRAYCCFSYLQGFRLASRTRAETDYTNITERPEVTIR